MPSTSTVGKVASIYQRLKQYTSIVAAVYIGAICWKVPAPGETLPTWKSCWPGIKGLSDKRGRLFLTLPILMKSQRWLILSIFGCTFDFVFDQEN